MMRYCCKQIPSWRKQIPTNFLHFVIQFSYCYKFFPQNPIINLNWLWHRLLGTNLTMEARVQWCDSSWRGQVLGLLDPEFMKTLLCMNEQCDIPQQLYLQRSITSLTHTQQHQTLSLSNSQEIQVVHFKSLILSHQYIHYAPSF